MGYFYFFILTLTALVYAPGLGVAIVVGMAFYVFTSLARDVIEHTEEG